MGGMLSPVDYQEFFMALYKPDNEALKNDAPVIAFGKKGCWFALREMANSNAAALGIDWTCSAQNARYLTGGKLHFKVILTLQDYYLHLMRSKEWLHK